MDKGQAERARALAAGSVGALCRAGKPAPGRSAGANARDARGVVALE